MVTSYRLGSDVGDHSALAPAGGLTPPLVPAAAGVETRQCRDQCDQCDQCDDAGPRALPGASEMPHLQLLPHLRGAEAA